MTEKHVCKFCGATEGRFKKLDGKGYVCPQCEDLYCIHCLNCNKPIDRSLGYNTCTNCSQTVYDSAENNYGVKPAPIFFNGKYDTHEDIGLRYYGMELEFNNVSKNTVHDKLEELYNDRRLYNKHDGSIGSGTEVVTSPMCRSELIKTLDKFEELKSYFDRVGYSDVTDNAGIHIHVNRKSIPASDIYKISYLLNFRASQDDSAIIYYIAGRNSEVSSTAEHHYCSVGSTEHLMSICNKRNLDRHIAFNIQPKRTVEFRIFKSTPDVTQMKAYVEIVDNIISFCHESPLREINVNNFIYYLSKNAKNEWTKKRVNKVIGIKGIGKGKEYNIYKDEELCSLLDSVPIEEYYRLLTYISGERTRQGLKRNIKVYLDSAKGIEGDRYVSDDQVLPQVKKVASAYREYLINKIMGGKKKCA